MRKTALVQHNVPQSITMMARVETENFKIILSTDDFDQVNNILDDVSTIQTRI